METEVSNLLNLKGKVVVVTGSSRGLGLEIVKNFLFLKSTVCGGARNSVKLGPDYFHTYLDLNSISSIEEFALKIEEKYHHVDILIHNAAVPGRGGLADISLEQWDEVMNVNVKGPLFLTQAIMPLLNDYGSIIFVSTIITEKIKKDKLLYSISKGAINTLVRNLSVELAEKNIRVNAVSPAIMETDFRGNNEYIKKNFNEVIAETPLKRICVKEEVANAVVFLSSNLASGITGINLKIDLGRSLI
jgi:NAD(P)-dependent dehydrogenase (short-subunit alcohol dehydrogenase family)